MAAWVPNVVASLSSGSASAMPLFSTAPTNTDPQSLRTGDRFVAVYAAQGGRERSTPSWWIAPITLIELATVWIRRLPTTAGDQRGG
jgi:hypothetical protein